MADHQHHHDDRPDWDLAYDGTEQVWSGQPNEALVREVADMFPRRAVDVGCGEGADAIWLASHDWEVTALDVAAKAVERGRRAAEAAGVDVTWLATGLEDAPADEFDLVIAFYPALEKAQGAAVDRLLELVAPDGTLLVVHHADFDRERALSHGFDPDDYVGHDDVVQAVTEAGWTIEEQGRRDRSAPEGPGAHHHVDLVLKARRLP